MLWLDVECTTASCLEVGRLSRVVLRRMTPTVVELPRLACARCLRDVHVRSRGGDVALRRCRSCTTLYAVGLARCPHCGSAESHEEGTEMPKITRHGGPTDARADAEPEAAGTPGPAEPAPKGRSRPAIKVTATAKGTVTRKGTKKEGSGG